MPGRIQGRAGTDEPVRRPHSRSERRSRTVRPRRAAVLIGALLVAGVCGVPSAGADDAAGTVPSMSQSLQSDKGCVTRSKVTQVAGGQWTRTPLGLDRVAELGEGDPVTVAVLDTGVDAADVPQLAGQVTAGPRITGPADADCVGHGTFLAALIAAKPGSGRGFSGVMPGARIYSLAVTDKAGATTAGSIADGIDAAVSAGARVIDVGVGTPQGSARLAQAVEHATANGSLVIAPVTLDGQTKAVPIYPAAYPAVLSVAASGPWGALPADAVAGAPVDLTGPGVGVVGPGPFDSGYFTGSGASYATAFVAGSAALAESYLGPLTPAQLTHRLETTALHPGSALPDRLAGYGAVDTFAAMTAVLPEESKPSGQVEHRPGHGSASAPSPGELRLSPVPGESGRRTSLVIAGSALALVGFIVLAAMTLVRGRRRSWRPGVATGRAADERP